MTTYTEIDEGIPCYKAIVTKWMPCTATKPTRLKVSAEGVKTKYYTWHSPKEAARKFADSYNWYPGSLLVPAGLPDGSIAWVYAGGK